MWEILSYIGLCALMYGLINSLICYPMRKLHKELQEIQKAIVDLDNKLDRIEDALDEMSCKDHDI